MNEFSASSDDHRPLMWLGGRAIYAAHFIVLFYVATMLVTTILMAFNAGELMATWLPFSSVKVLHGEAWRLVTYGWVNPPDIWFVIDMFLIGWFGRELEKFFGLRTFLVLFGCVYLLSPVLFTAVGRWWPVSFAGETGGFALFIAFATLYPNVSFFFNILAKWLAAILVGIFTLIALSQRNVVSLVTLWATVGFAHAFVRYEQGRFTFPRIKLWRTRGPKLRVLPDPGPEKAAAARGARQDSMAEIDALLDKIARSGMASLTAKERAKLDAAREQLLRKG